MLAVGGILRQRREQCTAWPLGGVRLDIPGYGRVALVREHRHQVQRSCHALHLFVIEQVRAITSLVDHQGRYLPGRRRFRGVVQHVRCPVGLVRHVQIKGAGVRHVFSRKRLHGNGLAGTGNLEAASGQQRERACQRTRTSEYANKLQRVA